MAKKIKQKPSTFVDYVKKERLLINELIYKKSECKSYRDEQTIRFSEGAGKVAIFSASQANDHVINANMVFGGDRKHFAMQVLRELSKTSSRKDLAPPPASEDVDELLMTFPNFKEAIQQVGQASALSRLSPHPWLQMTPLLLNGPPGVGKTAFAQALAQKVGVDFNRIDIGTISMGSILSGLSFAWGNGHVGEIFKIITKSTYANPIIMLDELDKMSASKFHQIEPVLLSLLEQESAKSFKEEAILLDLNCRHIIWLATSNELDNISEPLKSRFHVVEIDMPTEEETRHIVRHMYRQIKNRNPWGRFFSDVLSDDVVDKLTLLSPRQISKALNLCFGRAAQNARREIKVDDILVPVGREHAKIGFY